MWLAGGVHQAGGTVKDCIVYGNGQCDYYWTKGTIDNVCTNDPAFADGAADDYSLSSATPCPTAGYRPLADTAAFGCAFTASARTVRGDAGGTVTFVATAKNAPGEVAYTWSFGDGATAGGAEVTHAFAPGVWSVKLTATAGGATATASSKTCVYALPETRRVSTTAELYAALALHPLVLELEEGTYDVSKCPLWVLEPMIVRGVGERDNVILDAGTANYTRCLVVGDPEARVENIKIYCGNTNLMYALVPRTNEGVSRETYFFNQVRKDHDVAFTGVGDFVVDGKWTFEVGGRSKGFDQIAELPNSFVVNDDTVIGHGNKIPLWLFGFLY